MPSSTAMKIKLGMLKGIKSVGKAVDFVSRATVQTVAPMADMMTDSEKKKMRAMGKKMTDMVKRKRS